MKIQQNITVFAGDTQSRAQVENENAKNSGAKESGSRTIYAGNFMAEFPLRDRIEQKKAQAQARAMKIVDDAWNVDKELDDEIAQNKERIEELRQDNKDIWEIFGEDGRDMIAVNNREIEETNAVIRGIRGERRKHHPMVDAQNEAEDVLAAARDEIIGMVMEEAKDHVDEEQEKREEQAEAIEEKKEELEEIQEKRDEREEELEELIEDMPVKEMADLDQTLAEIKRQVQNILNEAHLVAEDIKGAKVDASL